MKKRQTLKLAALALLLVLLAGALVPAALAFEEREGNDVIIGADEVVDDDLFVGAQNSVVIDGVVNGDVMGGAETIEINGTVDGDLFVGATSIVINGEVTGAVYVGGANITINGVVGDDVMGGGFAFTFGPESRVGGDLLAGAYSIETRDGSEIGDDVIVGGTQMLLGGTVADDVIFGGAALELNGMIGGDVEAGVAPQTTQAPEFTDPATFWQDAPTTPQVAYGLTLGDGARIAGDLRYSTSVEADLPASAVDGDIVFDATPVEANVEVRTDGGNLGRGFFRNFVLAPVGRFIALLLVGLLLGWLVPQVVDDSVAKLQEKPLPSLGWGTLVAFLFIPVVLLLVLALVVVGILVGLVTLGDLVGTVVSVGTLGVSLLFVLFGFIWSYGSRVVVGTWIGRSVMMRFNPDSAMHRIWPLVLGLAFLAILSAIPVLGWLVGLIAALLGLGTLFLLLREGPPSGSVFAPASPLDVAPTGDMPAADGGSDA